MKFSSENQILQLTLQECKTYVCFQPMKAYAKMLASF